MGERYIEADNGFGWSRKHGSSPLSVLPGIYEVEVFGLTYQLQKFEDPKGEQGWYLYSTDKPSDFWGEFCATNLLPAIDAASERIAKADLSGAGYERRTT
jgi:hypothetical protein